MCVFCTYCICFLLLLTWYYSCSWGHSVTVIIFLVYVCLTDFSFPPCLTVCGPVISPWWSAMVTSFLIHLVTVWQSVCLAVFSSMFSSLWFCLFLTSYGHDTYIYHFHFLSVPLAVRREAAICLTRSMDLHLVISLWLPLTLTGPG